MEDPRPASLVTVGGVCEQLHQAFGLEFIADSCVRARLDPDRIRGRRPVVQLLDTVAGELDYGWEKEGNLIRLRNDFAFRDRYEEVPERVLRPWRERAARLPVWGGPPSLDLLAALAAALDDRQARGMHHYWGWYLEGMGIEPPFRDGSIRTFYHEAPYLRFWATLSTPQKQLLLARGALPVQQMSLPQRRAFLGTLVEGPSEPVPVTGIPERALAGAFFQIHHGAHRRQRYLIPGPDGRRHAAERIDVLGPEGRAGVISSLMAATVDGTPLDWQQAVPVGVPYQGNQYIFEYRLPGREHACEGTCLEIRQRQNAP